MSLSSDLLADALGAALASLFRIGEGGEFGRMLLCKDACLVQRFIEVKARSEAKARIELKGNELTAAEQYQNRYFLYRFFETEKEEFILAILQNPLTCKEAILPAIEVNLGRAQGTRVFRLSGGLSRHGESESLEPQMQAADLTNITSNEAQT